MPDVLDPTLAGLASSDSPFLQPQQQEMPKLFNLPEYIASLTNVLPLHAPPAPAQPQPVSALQPADPNLPQLASANEVPLTTSFAQTPAYQMPPASYLMPPPAAAAQDTKPVATFTPLEAADPKNEEDRNLLSSVNSYLSKGGDINVFSPGEIDQIRSIAKGLNGRIEDDPEVLNDPKAFKELVFDKHKYAPRLLDELGNPIQDPLGTAYNTGKMALNIIGGVGKNILDLALGAGQIIGAEFGDIAEGKFPGYGSSIYKEREILDEAGQRNADLWLSLMPHGAMDIFLDAKARIQKAKATNPQEAEAADMAQSELIRNGILRQNQADRNVAQVKANNVQSLIDQGLTGPAQVVQNFQASPQQEAVGQMLTDPTTLLTEGVGKLAAMGLVGKAGVATSRLEEATAALKNAHANVLDIGVSKADAQFLLDNAKTDADRLSAQRALAAISKPEAEAYNRFSLAQKELSAAQNSVNQDLADAATPSRIRKVSGDALVDLGNALQKPALVTDWVKSIPSKVIDTIMPNASEDLKQTWSGVLAQRFLLGGVSHFLLGGPVGGWITALGGPEVMRWAGREMAMIGEQLGLGQQTLPFWKAIKENSVGMTHGLASMLDNQLVYAIPDTARGAALGGLVGGALGTVSTGGTTKGFEQGASGGLLFGGVGAGLGQLKKFNSPGELHAGAIGDRARFVRSLHPDQATMFNRLDPNVQLALSVYARTHPDLDVTFFSDPSRANGSHQVVAGRGVANINVQADNPLKVVFQHEVGHHVASHGLTGQVDTYMIGDATSGQPGIFTKRNPDGTPMIQLDRFGRQQYVPDENFEAYKAQYNARLPKDHPPEDNHGIAQELFADLHAEALSDPRNVQKLVRGGYIPDALVNDNAVSNWLARVGVGIDGDTGRALITDTVAKTKGLNDMITEFYRQRSYKSKPPENDIGDTRIPVSSAQKGTPEFEFLQKTFNASGDLKRNPDHSIAVDSTGRPQVLPQKTVDAIHGKLADHIVSWLRNNPNHSERDNPNVVRLVTDRDGRQFYRGQVLPKEMFNELAATNQYNPNQLLNWQRLNGIMTRNDGTIVLGVYNTAAKQGRYSSLPARERAVVPIYHEISPKTRQVNIKSYDPEQMMTNLSKFMKKKAARDIWDGNLTNASADVKAYLDNLANGRPSQTGIGMEKKSAINQLFGFGNDADPTLNALSRGNTSVFKNFRLDRLNRLQEMPGYQQPFHEQTYEQVRAFLQPREGGAAVAIPETAPTEDPTAIPVTYRQTRTGKDTEVKIPYDLTKSPLYAEKQPDEANLDAQGNDYAHKDFMPLIDQKRLTQLNKNSAVTAGADKLVDQYNTKWKDNPQIMEAKGWYDHVRKYLGKAFGGDNRLFAELLAATSAGQGVIQNWKDALEAYRMYRKGAYDDAIKELKRTGKVTPDMQPRKENGALYGYNSNAVLKVLANTWFSTVEGPKTPNFFQNLFKQGKQATIDLWAARTMRRLGHEGVEGADPQWRLQPGSETGVSNLDFGFSQEVFRQAAERLGIDPHQLQAIAWYGEKLHWADKGWSKGGAAAAMESYIPQLKAYSEAPAIAPQAKGKDSRRHGVLSP